jgi:hypothetical protein
MNIETLSLETLDASNLLDDIQTAQALKVQPNTLAVWRSTGRYDLPYVKCGRLVRYRVGDVRAFIAKRTRQHTGEV